MEVKKGSQVYLRTEDQAGELAKVLGIVSDAGVNGVAYAGYADAETGHIMLVTEENTKVVPLLKEAGYDLREDLVALVTDGDAPGSAYAIAKKVADAGISLDLVYAASAGGQYMTVLRSADVDALIAALQ
jgi:hypothetical protein